MSPQSPAPLLALSPCPFCGAGENRIDEKTYWTGMRSELLTVTVRHWCERIEGQPQSLIQITRKTRDEAITAWNTREPDPAYWQLQHATLLTAYNELLAAKGDRGL